MDDLISRQAAIDAIKAYLTFADWKPSVKEILKMAVNDNTDMLERLPSAQPEIIRCKDCKFRKDGLPCNYDGVVLAVTPPRCGRMFGFIDDDGWCYKGERIEE